MRTGLILALLLGAAFAGCIRDIDDPSALRIHRIDVAAPVVTSGTAVLAVNASIDNGGGESGPVRLVAKAYDTSTGLLTVTNASDVGTIPEDTTVDVEVRLPVPRESGYRIEVLLREDDRVVQGGQVHVANVGGLEPTAHETALAIESMDFLVRNASGKRVLVETKVYVTNEGDGPADPLRMQLKAREVSTGLLSDENDTTVSGVGVGETKAFPVRLVVPDGYNYVVEAVLWDGDLIVGRGQGNVQLLPTFVKDRDTELVVTQPQITDFVRHEGLAGDRSAAGGAFPYAPSYGSEDGHAEPQPEVPGFGAALALAAVAAAALVVARRRR